MVATITALSQYSSSPFSLAYDSNKGEIWVANSTRASPISDATNQIVANVTNLDLAGQFSHIAYDPGTGEVFVNCNTFAGSVPPICKLSQTAATPS